jgi:hyaluronoglucosaminidase
MNCYLSMMPLERQDWDSDLGRRWADKPNRWWEPLPGPVRAQWEQVVRACHENGIEFCFAMNPNIHAPREFDYRNPEHVALVWRHYEWMQGLGVRWFCIALDDLRQGINASAQAEFITAFLDRLRDRDPQAQMVMAPTWYRGADMKDPEKREYVETLARELHPDVYIFWSGDDMAVNPVVTRKAAEEYKTLIGHRLILWDNFPVNDAHPTIHLGPLTGRDTDLYEVIDGYMANPLCSQNEINRIPLATAADYAFNPWAYDPARSIGQAILHESDTPAQAAVLKDLVELYNGMLFYPELKYNQFTRYNPVRERFDEIVARPHNRFLADLYLNHVRDVLSRLQRQFPDRYAATRKTIQNDLDMMQEIYNEKYE